MTFEDFLTVNKLTLKIHEYELEQGSKFTATIKDAAVLSRYSNGSCSTDKCPVGTGPTEEKALENLKNCISSGFYDSVVIYRWGTTYIRIPTFVKGE